MADGDSLNDAQRVVWAREYLRQRIEQAPGGAFDTERMNAWLTEAVGDAQVAALVLWEALDEGRLTSKPGDRHWLRVPSIRPQRLGRVPMGTLGEVVRDPERTRDLLARMERQQGRRR